MSISVSGLGSGLKYDEWITELVAVKQAKIDEISTQVSTVTKQKSALSTLKSDYTSLLDSIEKFTTAISSEDVFSQKAVTSSSDAVSAAVTSSSTTQNLKVTVSQLATATTAKSTSFVASAVDGSTKLSEISGKEMKAGTFSVYVGGTKSSITIDADSTMQDVLDNLNAINGVSATLSTDGKLTIGPSNAASVTVGASSDTSNFGKVMSLVATTNLGVTTYSSSKSIFDTDTSAKLTTTSFAAGSVGLGTFTIGNDEFEIKADTTLDSLIKEINASEDAGVSASWDSNSGKLILEAKDQGAININIEAGTSNFTDVMGLTSAGSLTANSQTLGTNAVLTINGTEITSASNTVTSDISGIKGLTLTLNDKTTTTANVAITKDTKAVQTAIETFVTAYNKVITDTSTATSATGLLHGESALRTMKNSLQGIATTTAGDNSLFKTLGAIGISTGAFSTNVKADTSKLVIDTDKLTAALQEDPDAVKNLLLGNKDTSTSGVFSKMETVLDDATNVAKGYFVKRDATYDKKTDLLNDKIDRKTLALTKYQKSLESKFSAMDSIISKLNSQSSSLTSFLNQLNNSNSKN